MSINLAETSIIPCTHSTTYWIHHELCVSMAYKVCLQCFQDQLNSINPACRFCNQKFTTKTMLRMVDLDGQTTHHTFLISRLTLETLFRKNSKKFQLVRFPIQGL